MARLEVLLIGAASDEPLEVMTIDGQVCANTPLIRLEAGQRKAVTVEFAEPYTGPIRVVLSEAEEGSGNAD